AQKAAWHSFCDANTNGTRALSSFRGLGCRRPGYPCLFPCACVDPAAAKNENNFAGDSAFSEHSCAR
ncbi:unnamed protein product, partial [Prorocentrum cordatum]